MDRRGMIVFTLVLLFGILSGRDRKPEEKGPQIGTKPSTSSVPTYNLAVHPLHSLAKLIQAYQPLRDYMNNRVQGAHLSLEASRDYANFEEKCKVCKAEFLLSNPWQILEAINFGYYVITMAGESQDFMGIFVVRKDSNLTNPTDLKGKAVNYHPSPTALAASATWRAFPKGKSTESGGTEGNDLVSRNQIWWRWRSEC